MSKDIVDISMITGKKIDEILVMEGKSLIIYEGHMYASNRRYFIFDDTGMMRLLDPLVHLGYIGNGVYRTTIVVESDYDQVIAKDYIVDYELVSDTSGLFREMRVADIDRGVSKLLVRIAMNAEEPSSGGMLDSTGTMPVRYTASLEEYDDRHVEVTGGVIMTSTDTWYQILSIRCV